MQWNPRKCAVIHIRRGVQFQESFGIDIVGELLIESKFDSQLCKKGCFSWLNKWRSCSWYTIAGAFEMYEQLLPTKL